MKKHLVTGVAVLLAGCASYEAGVPDVAVASGSPGEAIVAGNTAFAVDLYTVLKDKSDKNIFVSPASISTAFGLAYAGAEGETEAEIARVMHFDTLPEAEFHSAMGELLCGFEVDTGAAQLSINNALWVDKLTVLEEDYAALTAEHYGAGDFRVDYRGDHDAARQEINMWVEDKTNDRIKNLLAEPHVKDTTRSVLVNTIYMDAEWADLFHEAATKDKDFALLARGDAQVPMMHKLAWFRHWQNRKLQVLELPYQGNELSMIVLLPKRENGLPALEEELTAALLEGWLRALAASPSVEVDLQLPKIKLEDKYQMVKAEPEPLDNILPALGMRISFSDDADFAGAVRAERQPDGWRIKLDDVIHQTFLDVDERGTEAAAATALASVIVTSGRRGPPPPPPIPFYADHPYLFLIKDNETGMILFLGRVMDPR